MIRTSNITGQLASMVGDMLTGTAYENLQGDVMREKRFFPRYRDFFERQPRRDADGSLVGWRYWRISRMRMPVKRTAAEFVVDGETAIPTACLGEVEDAEVLTSPAQGTPWRGPVLRARSWCDSDAVEGRTGIHARWSPLTLRITGDWLTAYGRVRGSGRYVTGTRGWRAEIVTVDRLYLSSVAFSALRGRFEDRYQCVVRPLYGCFRPDVVSVFYDVLTKSHVVFINGQKVGVVPDELLVSARTGPRPMVRVESRDYLAEVKKKITEKLRQQGGKG